MKATDGRCTKPCRRGVYFCAQCKRDIDEAYKFNEKPDWYKKTTGWGG